MNTHQDNFWIEPATPSPSEQSTAVLEPSLSTGAEIVELTASADVFSAANIFEDSGGTHLTALDDW
jgi:hypothetical protein